MSINDAPVAVVGLSNGFAGLAASLAGTAHHGITGTSAMHTDDLGRRAISAHDNGVGHRKRLPQAQKVKLARGGSSHRHGVGGHTSLVADVRILPADADA